MTSFPCSRECLVVEARIAGARPDGRFELQVDAASACRACAGTCLWRNSEHQSLGPFHAAQTVRDGSRVSVSIPGRSVLVCAAFVYGLPLFLMLAGALLGQGIFARELAAVLGASMGLGGGVLLLSRLTPKLQRSVLRGFSIREIA